MLKKLRHPYIIDVEASGFGHDSYPIEIGIALADDDKYCTLIKPQAEWTYWDQEAEKVHGISLETLDKYGKPAELVADDLNQRLDGLTLFTDGWVVDKPWISKLFDSVNKPMHFQISPLERILAEEQMEKWHDTKDEIIKNSDLQRHRASNDAWIIQQTYKRTLQD